MDVEAVEKAMGVAIVHATDEIAEALYLEPFSSPVLAIMQPHLHDVAVAFMAAAEAGDTPEQFAARMAALNAQEA